MKAVPGPSLAEQIFAAFMDGLSVSKVARKLGTKPTVVSDVLREMGLKAFRAKQQVLAYKRITIRLTPQQYATVFTGSSCPVEIGQPRFHLTPDEATQIFGWLNDEILEEKVLHRRKVLDNLAYKMKAEERRAAARCILL